MICIFKKDEIIGKLPHHIIMIHTGWDSSPSYYDNIIKHYPKKIFILAHMKEDNDSYNTNHIHILKKYNNVFIETSYLSSPKRITQYVNLGFENKLLFGSDFRGIDDEVSLKWFVNAIELTSISKEAKEKILLKNAQKLLNSIKT